ncbi:MAG TPA: heparan-alpha-glucosaminide N-acetyltransferase domain-containing protein [Puia sp.]|nr:heparan-alpha-glucosaminide N-acetyltransferase domain-containing protein [Puia sp.]
MKRITSIDIARGLVMIIMALDHTRDLLHTGAAQNPTNLATTTPLLFFTRWITHLCAPSFVFLSGTSAYLSALRRNDTRASRRWLFSRGIFLVLLEVTLVNFGIWYDIYFRTFLFQVIAAIGFSFIGLGLLYKLPVKAIGIIGVLIIFLHDLLNQLPMVSNPVLQVAGALLFGNGLFKVGGANIIFAYPILPWMGIMLAGYACGRVFTMPEEVRKKRLLHIGLIALGLFILLRASNLYGDVSKWRVQKNAVFSFLSFINVSKYPPSLLYTLLTLGILMLFLSFIEGKENGFTRAVTVYGKVPMFYYLIHWNVIHLLMLAVVFLEGYSADQLVFGPFQFGRPPGAGVSLAAVYLLWLCVVASLYPLCVWYGRYKAHHPEKRWLRYL